ncbi:metalloregulator ArsR/SmtB family transcription factor [Labrenzia sp. VG12]|uniref:metalloregulator ArsR/SmtB family transcription factor n=1 Tax=Labrenzia sp. VG12 TaxID=2021862 RepID=UPI000B8C3015|nr:metalloregulator ArsR/SmtB family transcription factor [Labrenzia sp. VG12]ASP31925.1 transcriptional regulator [Labrenzia sp. VG12]
MSDLQESVNAAESGGIQKIFEALASAPRRKILAYLSHSSLTAGEIADRFDMSKPSISQHLGVLESAGLVRKEKRGQYVHYSIVQESLTNTLNSYVQEVCPVSRPLKKESAALKDKTRLNDS